MCAMMQKLRTWVFVRSAAARCNMNFVVRGSSALALGRSTSVVSLLADGCVVGFLIAAPVGPIGLLCIRRALENGWRIGFATGLGAAVADAIYAAIAALGISSAIHFVQDHARTFALVGMFLLALLALQTFRSALAPSPRDEVERGTRGSTNLVAAFIPTIALTLVNPATIASFVAAFSLIVVRLGRLDWHAGLLFAAGALIGSAFWWLLLSGGVAAVRTRLSARVHRAITIASACGLLLFAVVFGWRALT